MTFFSRWLKVKLTDQEQRMISNYEEDVQEIKNRSRRKQKNNDRQYMEEVYESDQWLANDEAIIQDLNISLNEIKDDVTGIPQKHRFFKNTLSKWERDDEY